MIATFGFSGTVFPSKSVGQPGNSFARRASVITSGPEAVAEGGRKAGRQRCRDRRSSLGLADLTGTAPIIERATGEPVE
jgi:hypothetical protein